MIEIAADLRFGTGETGHASLGAGWAKPEPGYIWSLGRESRLTIAVEPGAGSLFLELEIEPFVLAPALRRQRLLLRCGQTALGEWVLEGRAVLGTDIPSRLADRKAGLVLDLIHPDAARPVDLHLNTDKRRLGIRLRRAVLLRVPSDKPPRGHRDRHRLEQVYGFAPGGSGLAHLGDGWTGPEGDASWSIGHRSVLRLPLAHPGDRYTLLAEVNARTTEPDLPSQRFVVGANDRMVATFALGRHTTLALPLPPAATTAPIIALTLDNLDSDRAMTVSEIDPRPLALSLFNLRLIRLAPEPANPTSTTGDTRPPLDAGPDEASLAAAIHARTGLTLPDLLLRFEALRHGCELAQAQNATGYDPPSLLRFVGIGNAALIRGIATRFIHLGRPDRIIEHTPEGTDTIGIRELGYEMLFKTPYPVLDRPPPERIVRVVARRLAFLRRQFLDDLDRGDKIFVLRSLQETTRPEAEAVSVALRLHGRHTLLWLTQEGVLAPGSVTRLGPDLLQGELDVTGQYGTASQAAWISVLAGAWEMIGPN